MNLLNGRASLPSMQAGHTLTADTVKPAFVDPIPVVTTARGMILLAYFRNCDFPWGLDANSVNTPLRPPTHPPTHTHTHKPVPGSPTMSMWDSPRMRVPDASVRATPPTCRRHSLNCNVQIFHYYIELKTHQNHHHSQFYNIEPKHLKQQVQFIQ